MIQQCCWLGLDGTSDKPPVGTAWEEHNHTWSNRNYDKVRGSLACVPGDVMHLYHGTRPNRQYVERYKILSENAYDPVRDVDLNPVTGCCNSRLSL